MRNQNWCRGFRHCEFEKFLSFVILVSLTITTVKSSTDLSIKSITWLSQTRSNVMWRRRVSWCMYVYKWILTYFIRFIHPSLCSNLYRDFITSKSSKLSFYYYYYNHYQYSRDDIIICNICLINQWIVTSSANRKKGNKIRFTTKNSKIENSGIASITSV